MRRLLVTLLGGMVLAASLGAVETLAQRRRRVEAMSAEQREALFRSEQLFHDLSPQEQQRIRDLHDQIESAPDRDKLLATMNRYSKWFETQPAFRRFKLSDRKATLKDRLATVEQFLKIVKKQGPSKDIDLDNKNRRFLAAWLDRYAVEHEARFIEGMAHANPEFAKLPKDQQQAVLRENLLRRWQSTDPKGEMHIAGHERVRLLDGLSPELRAKLEAKEPRERDRIIAGWLRETASHELDEQLEDFFANTIDYEERDRLMSLPGDEMYKSLGEQYRAYLKQSLPAEPPRDRSRPRGRRLGPPRGSAARHGPESRDEKDPRAGFDPKSNPDLGAPEKTRPENPPAVP
jgi:hypothetical protein